MADIKQTLTKYWPYLLGGAAGLIIISRYATSSGGSSNVVYGTDPGSIDLARIGAEASNARYIADTQLAIEKYRTDGEIALGFALIEGETYMAALDTERAVTQSLITADTTVKVAEIGAAVQSMYAYSELVHAMNEPIIAGINANTALNIAAVDAITDMSIAQYAARRDIYQDEVDITGRNMREHIYTSGNIAGLTAPAWARQGQTAMHPPMLNPSDVADFVKDIAGVFG